MYFEMRNGSHSWHNNMREFITQWKASCRHLWHHLIRISLVLCDKYRHWLCINTHAIRSDKTDYGNNRSWFCASKHVYIDTVCSHTVYSGQTAQTIATAIWIDVYEHLCCIATFVIYVPHMIRINFFKVYAYGYKQHQPRGSEGLRH